MEANFLDFVVTQIVNVSEEISNLKVQVYDAKSNFFFDFNRIKEVDLNFGLKILDKVRPNFIEYINRTGLTFFHFQVQYVGQKMSIHEFRIDPFVFSIFENDEDLYKLKEKYSSGRNVYDEFNQLEFDEFNQLELITDELFFRPINEWKDNYNLRRIDAQEIKERIEYMHSDTLKSLRQLYQSSNSTT